MSRRIRGAILGALVATGAHAGGFAVADQDAEVSGRAGTAVAHQGSASAVHFNPAGLAALRGPSASVGVSGLLPSVSAKDPESSSVDRTELALKTPPHAYAAFGEEQWAVGLGFNTPFGGGVKWDDGWRGRYDLVEQKLEVFAGHLAGAYALNPHLSLGASLSLYRVNVVVDKRLDFVDQDGRALLSGGGTGLGASAGVQFTPRPELRFGFQARLPSPVQLRGTAQFTHIPESFREQAQDQQIQTSLTLPARLALGSEIDLHVLRPFTLFAEGEMTFWSAFERFAVDFERDQTSDVNQPRNWSNTLTGRLGIETTFGGTTARIGAFLDGAASPANTLSPSLPDSTRVGGSLGAGWTTGSLRADVAYSFIAFLPRASEGEVFQAQYSANAHLLALTLSFAPSRAPVDRLAAEQVKQVPLTAGGAGSSSWSR